MKCGVGMWKLKFEDCVEVEVGLLFLGGTGA